MNCSSIQKVLCGQEECSICYERSFATHERALMWSIENELQPYQVSKSSNKKFKFNCEDCGHVLEMPLHNVIKVNGANTVNPMDYAKKIVYSAMKNHLHHILWQNHGLLEMICNPAKY